MNTLSSVFGQRQGKLKSMIIILLLAFAIGYVGIYRSIYVHICRTRVYDDMAANTGMIMSANINIKPITVEDNITSYGAGASGVIYAKEKDTYYALTAAHVVSDTCKKHNAYGASGSSGGAVFDENMELVGINIVGGSDIFGRYMFLGMVTCDQIKECLEDFRPGNRF